jgi:NDP-mannose synthase
MTVALVMAGGRGERMRASGARVPKPLTCVGGVPLLERSLVRLLTSDFRDIVVSLAAGQPEVRGFVETRGRALARSAGAGIRVLEEREPLGNIGCAARIDGQPREVLVVYADNLTALDLRRVVEHHRSLDAAMTTAIHEEPFRLPYGEVDASDGRLLAYLEKPVHRVLVSSGVYVLGERALAAISAHGRTEVSALVNRLLREGAVVGAIRHEAPWVDVNDLDALARAERLVADHPTEFASWTGCA